jgi:hypothetical protein
MMKVKAFSQFRVFLLQNTAVGLYKSKGKLGNLLHGKEVLGNYRFSVG